MRIKWDEIGKRFYEVGVDHVVLYPQAGTGTYSDGIPWDGVISINENPSGAESNPKYADNIKYLNLKSAEEFGATIEAFTFPDEFAICDGTASPTKGVSIGQQARKPFGLAYRTLVGNDVNGEDHGYKLHLIYNGSAAPSERAYSTVNDSPDALTFSWEITTTPVVITEIDPITTKPYRPTSCITIDSRHVQKGKLQQLEDLLYGKDDGDTKPKLPTPDEIITMFK